MLTSYTKRTKYFNMKAHDTVWNLWPDIQAMSRALDESPVLLEKQKASGGLPDARHDALLVARSIYNGRPLKYDDLQKARETIKRTLPASPQEKRKERVKEVIEQLGGVDVVARRIGATRNTLYIARSRGRLPIRLRHELLSLGGERGVEIPQHLFEALEDV